MTDLLERVEAWRRKPMLHPRSRVVVYAADGTVLADEVYDAADNEAHMYGAGAVIGRHPDDACAQLYEFDGDEWVACCSIGRTGNEETA